MTERRNETAFTAGKPTERASLITWFARHPKLTIALVTLLLIAGAVFTVDLVARSRVDRHIAALRAKGEPVTVADLQALIPRFPKEEDFIAQIVLPAQEVVAACSTSPRPANLPFVGADSLPLLGFRFSVQQEEAVKEYLNGVDEPMFAIHEALKLENGCADPGLTSPWINMASFGPLSEIRFVSKTIALEILAAAHAGNADRVVALSEDALHLSTGLNCNPFLISMLVQFAADFIAMDQIGRAINLCEFNESKLDRLQSAAVKAADRIDLRESLMFERVLTLDTMWLGGSTGTGVMVLGPGFGGGLLSSGLWHYIPVLPAMDVGQGLGTMTEAINATQGANAQTLRSLRSILAKPGTLPWYCVYSNIVLPSMDRMPSFWFERIARNRTMQVTLAVERYRVAQGKWPESLSVLVPNYLPVVLTDPFDDQPIRYSQFEDGVKIYCIGENLIDDGGGLRHDLPPGSVRPPDTGFVLLNPDRRNQPAPTEQSGK